MKIRHLCVCVLLNMNTERVQGAGIYGLCHWKKKFKDFEDIARYFSEKHSLHIIYLKITNINKFTSAYVLLKLFDTQHNDLKINQKKQNQYKVP